MLFGGIYDRDDVFDGELGTMSNIENCMFGASVEAITRRPKFTLDFSMPTELKGITVANLRFIDFFKVALPSPRTIWIAVIDGTFQVDGNSVGTRRVWVSEQYQNGSWLANPHSESPATTWYDITPYYIDIESSDVASGAIVWSAPSIILPLKDYWINEKDITEGAIYVRGVGTATVGTVNEGWDAIPAGQSVTGANLTQTFTHGGTVLSGWDTETDWKFYDSRRLVINGRINYKFWIEDNKHGSNSGFYNNASVISGESLGALYCLSIQDPDETLPSLSFSISYNKKTYFNTQARVIGR